MKCWFIAQGQLYISRLIVRRRNVYRQNDILLGWYARCCFYRLQTFRHLNISLLIYYCPCGIDQHFILTHHSTLFKKFVKIYFFSKEIHIGTLLLTFGQDTLHFQTFFHLKLQNFFVLKGTASSLNSHVI